MNQPIRTLSGDTMHELRELLARERQRSQFGGLGEKPDQWVAEREVRLAKTTTNATHATYPSAGSNKFVVEFGQYTFDDTAVGTETPTFTAYTPQESRVAYSTIGFVAEGTIVRVMKSHGRWYIIPEGGSGTPVVMFVIDDILRGDGLLCNAVEATVLNVSCNLGSPAVGDSIEVWDSLGCVFNCPMELLIGVRGYATRMTTPPDGSDLADEQFPSGPQPETPCRWEVTALCCVEE